MTNEIIMCELCKDNPAIGYQTYFPYAGENTYSMVPVKTYICEKCLLDKLYTNITRFEQPKSDIINDNKSDLI